MPVPGLQKILLPLLSFFASDGRNHTVDEAVEAIATEFKLSPRDREEQVRSGPKRLEKNVAWALYSALPGMGVLERRGKGVFRITRPGILFLAVRQGLSGRRRTEKDRAHR